ncbi:hypothetical protein OIC43_42920 [Streptomyces sp. NBC_00825]|uniref:hypothetical protein n=1 Tax=unclassified Streptomyces TaxID=2593676 RepID=UPI0022561027|nr:hypothetical protein [Streptomyces sp. NBC_00906]MCX4900838.1 hypothetical protein [Streptomyces sp. NBC_00892]WTB51835.1 hypothetical protein OG832_00760 [Streptomyces sp. NBC_00826]WTH95272.1 hypothetical protein OIC43_42920 [Streptomyces sp. NBC_00825]WTI04006.1 hypothetical protein OHA23_42895 [Streptomyces sp. NBC_00822]MCX4869599.1 hypothetical protein [Streptomyces sp. NBC_00906]
MTVGKHMVSVTASVPACEPPAWAVLQRQLFSVLDEAWRVFEDRYCHPEGGLRFDGVLEGRDGADDFYEPFFNWPMLYMLGGSDDLLDASKKHWSGITRQLSEAGFLVDEYERGYDWFHQGESLLMFYGICAADPSDDTFRRRALRFAELYLPTSPVGNVDGPLRIIRAPHTGAGGPRRGVDEAWAQGFGAELTNMKPYGLPLEDLPGIDTWDDLAHPANARRMGEAMNRRLGDGDVAVNLASTSLIANAWLYTGEDRYRDWLVDYVQAWRDRAAAAGGVIPDNVGPSGEVGELHDGRWYGGSYGWTWPHGLHSVGAVAVVAAMNAALVTGDDAWFDLARAPLDRVLEEATRGPVRDGESSMASTWLQRLGPDADGDLQLVPYRKGLHGWFDHQPLQIAFPAWIWWCSGDPQDRQRLDRVERECGYDWTTVHAFRDKEEAGHEAPWLAYLDGRNPDYPARALSMALGQVARRMALIHEDASSLRTDDIHWWQRLNPVVTEILVQLTTGAPAAPYNGGLQQTRVRYWDAGRGRPGLPADVAALVEELDETRVGVQLVNLSNTRERRVVVQAGAFAEDGIDHVVVDQLDDGYPGPNRAYRADEFTTGTRRIDVHDNHLLVILPPGTRLDLSMQVRRRQFTPSHPTFDRYQEK